MPISNRGSRLDFAALEARRLQAADMFARGESQVAVARVMGVTTAAVNHWHQAWLANGRRGLKAVGRAGRKLRLRPTDRAPGSSSGTKAASRSSRSSGAQGRGASKPRSPA